jgi:hypothetical protein
VILDQFIKAIGERLPEPEDFVLLCEEIGISFGVGADGKPVLKATAANKAEAKVIADLFSREPFRSRVLALKGIASTGTPATEPEQTPAEAAEPVTAAPEESPRPWGVYSPRHPLCVCGKEMAPALLGLCLGLDDATPCTPREG